MSHWRGDVAASSLEEARLWQAENRAWSKTIRQGMSALVDSRLAKVISQGDYMTDRKRFDEEAVECRRRAALIDKQLDHCMLASMSRSQ